MSPALFMIFVAAFPDALDHLKAGEVVPQVSLLLDRSCSMADSMGTSECLWYANTYKGGNKTFNKNEQMKAVLTGCKAANDGVLDSWSSRVNFSVYEFGTGTSLRTPFDSTLAQLKSGVMNVPITGSTYMTQGIRDAGNYFNTYFTAGNTLTCRPNFIVLLTDGIPNGGNAVYDGACVTPKKSLTVGATTPWQGSGYEFDNPDLLCNVPGDQNIRTYSIGFGKPGDFSPETLQNIADEGDGEYFSAFDGTQLNAAFGNIISSIVARSALFFAPIAIQTGSLFADNFAYSASFKPETAGPWRGTVKKFCVVPPVKKDGSYDASVDTCLFSAPDGKKLLTNPKAMDQWTGSQSIAADGGGSGQVLLSQLNSSAGGVPAAPYWGHRNIVTWRQGQQGYVNVAPTTLTEKDTWTNGCEHYKLVNWLHGYTFDANCTTGAPIATASWPAADPVHFSPILLRYGDCQDSANRPIAGNCFLVTGMNDGMVHILDSANGQETTALVPAELWKPGVANNILRDMLDQPSVNYTHRYFVDGDARLFHEDSNADGVIQASETAYLLFGLGRGGRAYYSLPVSRLDNGKLDSTRNPILPLLPTTGTAFEDLQDTWAAPWVGMVEEKGVRTRVAAFATGHVPSLDFVTSAVPAVPTPPVVPVIDTALAVSVACSAAATFSGLAATWCDSMWIDSCKGNKAKPCYDAAGTPIDRSTPIGYDDGVAKAGAVRVSFKSFDISAKDSVRIEDSKGNLVGTYTNSDLNAKWSPWVYDTKLVVRLLTDGKDEKAQGYVIEKLEWVPVYPAVSTTPVAPGPIAGFTLGTSHHPSIYVLDLDKWNGATKAPFSATSQDGAILFRITNKCHSGEGTRCIDASTVPELSNFICPISAELSAFLDGSVATAFYVGDECGQIWKTWQLANGSWSVRRIVNLNKGNVAVSKDNRKIFRRVDVVQSACPGREVVGLYFGTGDIQRPTATDELSNAALSNGRDLMGLIWDYAGLKSGATDQDLMDLTSRSDLSAPQIFASGKLGWLIGLGKNERMLRDPLVFDRVAYFKTFEPTTAASECGAGSGTDRIYALQSCTSAAEVDKNADGTRSIGERQAWNGETEIGGGLFFFTPKDSPVLVSHADMSKKQDASLNSRNYSRPRLFMWREQ